MITDDYAAQDAAKTSTNPIYVEALELAARALEDNTVDHAATPERAD